MGENKNLAAAMCSVRMEGFTFDLESKERFAKLASGEHTMESHLEILKKIYSKSSGGLETKRGRK